MKLDKLLVLKVISILKVLDCDFIDHVTMYNHICIGKMTSFSIVKKKL